MEAQAFWNRPDWRGGDNLRSGATPFWMFEPSDHGNPSDWMYIIHTHEYVNRDNNRRIGMKEYRRRFGTSHG